MPHGNTVKPFTSLEFKDYCRNEFSILSMHDKIPLIKSNLGAL